MKKGYWMVTFHPDSRPITCMLINIEIFQLTHFSMGMAVASDVFQKKLDEIFHNLQRVTGIADDMGIYGKSIEEHDKHFLSFLSIVRKNNLKLNVSNYNFNLRKYPSLDTIGVPREYHQIPRMFKPFTRWDFPQAKSQCKVSLGLSIS